MPDKKEIKKLKENIEIIRKMLEPVSTENVNEFLFNMKNKKNKKFPAIIENIKKYELGLIIWTYTEYFLKIKFSKDNELEEKKEEILKLFEKTILTFLIQEKFSKNYIDQKETLIWFKNFSIELNNQQSEELLISFSKLISTILIKPNHEINQWNNSLHQISDYIEKNPNIIEIIKNNITNNVLNENEIHEIKIIIEDYFNLLTVNSQLFSENKNEYRPKLLYTKIVTEFKNIIKEEKKEEDIINKINYYLQLSFETIKSLLKKEDNIGLLLNWFKDHKDIESMEIDANNNTRPSFGFGGHNFELNLGSSNKTHIFLKRFNENIKKAETRTSIPTEENKILNEKTIRRRLSSVSKWATSFEVEDSTAISKLEVKQNLNTTNTRTRYSNISKDERFLGKAFEAEDINLLSTDTTNDFETKQRSKTAIQNNF